MSTSPPPSRIVTVAVWLWIAGGVTWAYASGSYAERWWALHPYCTFRYTDHTPEAEFRLQECDRFEQLAHFFRWWAFGYALVGLVALRRRGCSVFWIAVAIVAMSWFAQMAAGLGHL